MKKDNLKLEEQIECLKVALEDIASANDTLSVYVKEHEKNLNV